MSRAAWVLSSVVVLVIGVGLGVAAFLIGASDAGAPDAVPQEGPPQAGEQPGAGTPGEGGTGGESGVGGAAPWEVLGWIAVGLAIWAGYRAYRLYLATDRNTQLVVSDFGNSSGIAGLDGVSSGLSLLARQRLLEEMRTLRREVNAVASEGGSLPTKEATLPPATPDTKLTDLVKALSESVPDPVKPVVQLVALLVAPRGTLVTGRLQLRGDAPGLAGISLEIADIEGLREPDSDTFWETLPGFDRSPKGSPPSARDAPAPADSPPFIPPPARDAPAKMGSAEDAHVREARASYELGRLHEGKGALEQARAAYEEAAKKDPDNPAARVALGRVLAAPGRTPSERYGALLVPACRWLAAELFRDRMLAELSAAIDRRRRNEGKPRLAREEHRSEVLRGEAEIRNFVGSYHLYGGPEHAPFLRSAERNLRRAREDQPEWYLPHDNLGDVFSYTGRQPAAINSYDEALRLLGGSPTSTAALRIRLARGMAQLQSGDPVLREEATREIGAIRAAVEGPPVRSARLLYNLACWYAVFAQYQDLADVAKAEAVARARRYLAGALARDRTPELWAWCEKDPDLEAVRGGLGTLKDELKARLARSRGLISSEGDAFWEAIDQVLARAEPS